MNYNFLENYESIENIENYQSVHYQSLISRFDKNILIKYYL